MKLDLEKDKLSPEQEKFKSTMLKLYNLMAKTGNCRAEIKFDNGLLFRAEIVDTEFGKKLEGLMNDQN